MRPVTGGLELADQLLSNVVLFGRSLRTVGIGVAPHHIVELGRALEHVDISRREEFKNGCRCVLVQRRQDLVVFDRAFERFWGQQPTAERRIDMGKLTRRRSHRRRPTISTLQEEAPEQTSSERGRAQHNLYSNLEALRHKDFAELTAAERGQLDELLRQQVIELGHRTTRRKVAAGSGAYLDMRRVIRRSLHTGGEPLRLAWRRRKQRRRRFVLLCDISGSMKLYSRILLQFMYALGRNTQNLEAFLFGTRLTRITLQLKHRDVDQALREATTTARDWGSGTRIGDSVRAFNYHWGRRVLGQGATVAIISDGWDRGDIRLLGREMARLQRCCHRLLWLNPLLGSPEYQPLTRGIRAALPFVDTFLPIHNMVSLERLVHSLRQPVHGRSRQLPS